MVEFKADRNRVRAQLESLLKAVTGKANSREAWRSLVQPGERVGIKSGGGGSGELGSQQVLVDLIFSGIQEAGIPKEKITVWARTRAGYDAKQVYAAPVDGRLIWGDLLFKRGEIQQLSNESHLARELLKVDKIINVPVLCGSESFGVTGAIYNVTVPNVDNWRRFAQGPSFGDPYLPELYADERIGPKVVLNILDGLVSQYAGGPKFEPNYAYEHRTIYMSKDPVALDKFAWELVSQWRKEAQLPPLQRAGAYIDTAGAMGLGRTRFEIVEVAP